MKTTSPVMKIPSVDLKAQYATIRNEIRAAVDEILESQSFILGSKVEKLEQEIASYCRTTHAVGVASGTDALLLAIRAVGMERGDEVITSPFTFFATAGAIHNAGGVPVFVDIDPETFNIDPAKIEARITDRTKIIIPVHLYGQPAEMKPILEIARRHKLAVIEDAAQAIGAEYLMGGEWKKAGAMGDLGCISFFPSKNLGGLGDGGMVVTSNDRLREQVALLRIHGGRTKYVHDIVGYNSRLDALQAAALSVKLKYLDGWSETRRERAAEYNRLFQQSGLAARVQTPAQAPTTRPIFHQYVVRVERRDELQQFLLERGVSTAVYYPIPLHLQPCFKGLGYSPGNLPSSEAAAREALALPMYPELTQEMQEYVVAKIVEFYHP